MESKTTNREEGSEFQVLKEKKEKYFGNRLKYIDYSLIVVPFKQPSKIIYIYNDVQKISFDERIKEFKDILIQEFL